MFNNKLTCKYGPIKIDPWKLFSSLRIMKFVDYILFFSFILLAEISLNSACSYDSDSSISSTGSTSSSQSRDRDLLDFRINSCFEPGAFTFVHNSFRHYDHVIKNNINAAFVANIATIRKNRAIVNRIKNSGGVQTLILKKNRDFLRITQGITSICDLVEVARNVASEFKEKTGMDLHYVMLSADTPGAIYEAFNEIYVSVIYPARKVSNVLESHFPDYTGAVVIDSDGGQIQISDYATLRRAGSTPLNRCIPHGTVNKVIIRDEREPSVPVEPLEESFYLSTMVVI